jgi:large subunit ribosomal protein L4
MDEPILNIEEREAINAGRWFSSLSPSLRHDILRCAYVKRYKDGDLIVLDAATSTEAKTKKMVAAFGKLGLSSAVIVDGPEFDTGFQRAARNIPHIDLLPVAGFNVLDVLRRQKLVLTKAALAALEERLK